MFVFKSVFDPEEGRIVRRVIGTYHGPASIFETVDYGRTYRVLLPKQNATPISAEQPSNEEVYDLNAISVLVQLFPRYGAFKRELTPGIEILEAPDNLWDHPEWSEI